MQNKLRLLVTEDCNRECAGCCNKQWDLKKLPIVSLADLVDKKEIMLTGGEPMLHPFLLRAIINRIIGSTSANIYVYTAYVENVSATLSILSAISGMTITLHHQNDVAPFIRLLSFADFMGKSMRLNVFRGVELPNIILGRQWRLKDDMVWIPNCPLPDGEVFMRV